MRRPRERFAEQKRRGEVRLRERTRSLQPMAKHAVVCQRHAPMSTRTNPWAGWTTTLLVVNGILALADVAQAAWDLHLLAEASEGAFRVEPDLRAAAKRRELLEWAVLAALLGTAPVFLAWFHRAYANLEQKRTTAGRAVLHWFIPIAQLVLPYRSAREILGTRGNDTVEWTVFTWWTTWLSAGLFELLSGMAIRGGELTNATQLHLLSSTCAVFAAFSGARFVWKASRR